MTYEEAMGLIHGADWKHAKIGLKRMRDLLNILGNPDRKCKYIHIAGTNGKGSAAAMTANILKEAGYKTGLYISPNIGDFNERIQINGNNIPDNQLKAIAAKVKSAILHMDEEPVDFEIITAMAFLYFAEEKCDIVVLEVGLGGRLDATNVIDPPLVSAIMNIGLEHTEILGDTIEKIAGEKAGIIKKDSDVVIYHQSSEAESVFKEKFHEVNREEKTNPTLVTTEPERAELLSRNLTEQKFIYPLFYEDVMTLSLAGNYQIQNALVVLSIIKLLREKHGYNISNEAVKSGLLSTRWPGRFEVIHQNPTVIVDGAHNPNGVGALIKSIDTYFPNTKLIFVVGVMADKDYKSMIKLTNGYAKIYITELPQKYDRALDPKLFAKEIQIETDVPVIPTENINDAMKKAFELSKENNDMPIICFGSLYQVAAIKSIQEQLDENNSRKTLI